MTLKAPFPYFGGKTTVANKIWQALGQPKHYIEPFFGSGAVLLLRPNYEMTQHTETICDADGFVANAWRAIKFNPEETAFWADMPVNHADLIAKRKKLLANKDELLNRLCQDELYYDSMIAGYWIWAASCWIGAGLTAQNAIPGVTSGGKEIHSKGKIPHVGNSGMGIHKTGNNSTPHAGTNTNIYEWFDRLSNRLRYVRVVCGDWTRVCGGNWQSNMGICGMFFDPPYGDKDREKVYDNDSFDISEKVEQWVLERGADPKYRIVVAGYDTEYKSLVENGWTKETWKAQGGYANISFADTQGKINKGRETLWYSPHCLLDNKLF